MLSPVEFNERGEHIQRCLGPDAAIGECTLPRNIGQCDGCGCGRGCGCRCGCGRGCDVDVGVGVSGFGCGYRCCKLTHRRCSSLTGAVMLCGCRRCNSLRVSEMDHPKVQEVLAKSICQNCLVRTDSLTASLHHSLTASLPQCTTHSLPHSVTAPLHQCSTHCTTAPLAHCTTAPVHHSLTASLPHCTTLVACVLVVSFWLLVC